MNESLNTLHNEDPQDIFEFPKDFLWGTATSAHQTEGNNTNSNWWEWEVLKPAERPWPLEPSGIACDSYNRFQVDLDLAKQLNNNAIRFSIEWARIEPEKGKFSEEAIEHYKQVIIEAKKRGLKTFVTLHHFTNPQWLSSRGGWANPRSARHFVDYAKKCAEEFGEIADVFITINEPQVLSTMAYLQASWPPGVKNPLKVMLVQHNMRVAHRRAYTAIKAITPIPVGIVKNIMWFETSPQSSFLDKIVAKVGFFLNCDFYLIRLKEHLDFLGLNYYFTQRIEGLKVKNPNDYLSDLDWWINPPGLESILKHLKKYEIPIYITENGLADEGDKFRSKFIHDHLVAIWDAIKFGTEVKGYFYWSLIDNYEWHQGFWPKFGLVEIQRENNLERKPRNSFYYYADVCKNNRVVGKTFEN